MNIDHKLLVERNALEVARFGSFFRRLAKKHNDISDLKVVHERDGSCCKAEEWMDTFVLCSELSIIGREGPPLQ